MDDFGSRLRELRKRRGFTQKALADRINKSLSAVSSYETNAQMPPLDVLISIASVLNISLDSLAGFEHRDVIVVDKLSTPQKEFLRLVINEFDFPSFGDRGLSEAQKDLLNRLLCIFFNK